VDIKASGLVPATQHDSDRRGMLIKHTLPRPWSDRPAAVVESRRSVVASHVILCWEMASRGSRETVASSSQRRPVAAPSHVHWLTETTAFVLQIRLPTTSSWLPVRGGIFIHAYTVHRRSARVRNGLPSSRRHRSLLSSDS